MKSKGIYKPMTTLEMELQEIIYTIPDDTELSEFENEMEGNF